MEKPEGVKKKNYLGGNLKVKLLFISNLYSFVHRVKLKLSVANFKPPVCDSL